MNKKTDFQLDIKPLRRLTYQLAASQVLPIGQEEAFEFFEDPGNLCDITPPWLDFSMLNKERHTVLHENAEFDYTINFIGMKMRWRSRIIDYHPPEGFTDIQLKGPYKSWVHRHKLEKVPEGTIMRDDVTFKLSMPALLLYSVLIKKKLLDIFNYRAVKIAEWAERIKYGQKR